MQESKSLLVSICVITYNHEKFIGQCLESLLIQNTDFNLEIVIGEDLSTDKTLDVCEEYASKYPDIIKLLPSDKKYGAIPNFIRTLSECNGKYIAICEGDDFWVDPKKLEKQICFLENNPEFSICFGKVDVIVEKGANFDIDLYNIKYTKDVFTIEDVILTPINIMPTATILFRNLLPATIPKFFLNCISGDIAIQLLIADKGLIKFLDETYAVYRSHVGGMTQSKEVIESYVNTTVELLIDADKYFNYKYHKLFKSRLFGIESSRLIHDSRNKKGFEKIKHYFKYFPRYLKYSDKLNIKEIIYYHLILFFPKLLKKYGTIKK